MILTRLYRHGPSPQSIVKGYIVVGASADKIVMQVMAEQRRLLDEAGAEGITLRTSPRRPTTVWLDTGSVWLHTPEARDARFGELGRAVAAVSARVRQMGALLLPNAVRPALDGSWRLYLCEDVHRVQTSDELETATFCNLLRLKLPVLIAASGRAGVMPRGVEAGGSRRLAESTQHYPPHYLVSASAEHLQRVAKCLRRDEGIAGLDMLDVHPLLTSGRATLVELRFNDGQTLLSTTRSQALLYQAMFVCARRRTRGAQGFPVVSQRILQRNRARAVSEGLQARFERESPDGNARPRQGERARRTYHMAGKELLSLIENLQYELQVLEAEYSELAPLVLGATLRRLGHPGLQNENDLLRTIHRQFQGESFARAVVSMVEGQEAAGDLVQWNERLFPVASAEVKEWWEQMLQAPAGQGSASAAARR